MASRPFLRIGIPKNKVASPAGNEPRPYNPPTTAPPGGNMFGGAREQVLPGQLYFRGDRVKLNPDIMPQRVANWRGTILSVSLTRLGKINYMVQWDQDTYPVDPIYKNPSLTAQDILLPAEENNNVNMIGGRRKSRRARRSRKTKRRMR